MNKNNVQNKTIKLVVDKFGTIIVYAFCILICIISLYPFIWAVLSSFNGEISVGKGGLIPWPKVWTFDGYVSIFTKLKIQRYFLNSTIITITATTLSVLLVSMSSYVVSRFEFKFKKLISFIFISTLFIPGVAISYPIYRLMRTLNLYDTYFSVIFLYSGLGIAVTFFIIRNYYMGIPKSIEEAAYIEGCSYSKTFFLIVIPIAQPIMVTAFILAFLNNWNEFYFASLLLESRETMTLPALIGQFRTAYKSDINGILSATVVIMIPTIILFLSFSNVFVKSLSDGAVKE